MSLSARRRCRIDFRAMLGRRGDWATNAGIETRSEVRFSPIAEIKGEMPFYSYGGFQRSCGLRNSIPRARNKPLPSTCKHFVVIPALRGAENPEPRGKRQVRPPLGSGSALRASRNDEDGEVC